ncbi:hypothetical protein DITRI_Ditri20bG0121000 [Diplodiscus trichospermus]
MEDQADSTLVSKGLILMPGSDSKLVAVKRSIDDLEERNDVSPKRIKMRDLDSVIRSEEISGHDSKYLKRKESSQELLFSEDGVSQVTEVPVTFNFEVTQVERTKGDKLLAVVHPVSQPLDLNTEICFAVNESSDNNPKSEEKFDKVCSQESNCATSKRICLDLNAEDVSSSINHESLTPKNHESIHHKHIKNLKPKNVSECGSSIGPMEQKDSLRVWKEMKQNGFLSSSHEVPKQRGRKSKNDVLKKKMELAKKEQVDKFTKIAAPSGLLNGLNPGIINHVRNRKQVHSIIEALVKSEKLDNLHSESKQANQVKNGTKEEDSKKDHGNMDDAGLHRLSFYHEDGPPNASSSSKKMVDPVSEDDALALKLSSSAKASENACFLSNEESVDFTSASSLSVKAATVASQWLELLQQDIKGRLSALRRSKKKVRVVITTELPFLISKEFSCNQGSDPNVIRNSADGFSHDGAVEMHRARWSALFDQMDKALSEEEKQLESWLNQIKGMQLHCDQGLQRTHWNMLHSLPQLGGSENNIRSVMGDSFDRELAVRAAAASIYSTCNFMSSKENVPCSLI